MIVSIDGLPGIGKTTLGLRLGRRYNARLIPELCLPKLARCEYDELAFIRNDLYKIRNARNLGPAILDRSFCSTVTFEMAATQRVDTESFRDIQRDFYAAEPVAPDLMIIILSPPSMALHGLEKRGEKDLFSPSFLEDWWRCFRFAAQALSDSGVAVRCIPPAKTPLYRSFVRDSK